MRKKRKADWNLKIKILNQIKIKILGLQTKIIRQISYFRKEIIFRFSLEKLVLKNILRFKVLQYINAKRTFIGTVIYFGLLIFFTLILGRYVDPAFDKSDAITFFTAVAAMIGGILAIIFSLSILLMGNAAERIPVGFYETAAKDWLHDLIFFLISICSMVLFSFALLFGKLGLGYASQSFQLAMGLVGCVFYLTFIFYQRVRERLNPNNVLRIASKQAFEKLDFTHKRAQDIAEVLMRQPKLEKSVTKEEALATSFQYLQPEFTYINSRLNYLFDYHDKLVASNERSSALSVLQVITNILQKYFQTRKDSSLVLPAGFILATTSDSRAFLTPPLERLVAVGENYMRENDNEGITRVIYIFVRLCKSASEINYLTKHKIESPIMEQCRGYLNQLLESAIKFNHQEALFQGILAYEEIIPIVIKQNLQHEFITIYDMLDNIAMSALTNKYNVVFGQVVNTYTSILSQLISTKYFNLEMELGSLWEHLRNIIFYAYISMATGTLDSSFSVQTNLNNPFTAMSSMIFQTARAATNAETEEESNDWKEAFFTTTEELRSTLRYLSEKMKTTSHILVDTFGNIISDVGCLLVDLTKNEKWTNDKKELVKQIGWYIFQTEWFTHDLKKIKDNNSFDSLIEAASKIGIKAIHQDLEETAKDAIKILYNFANKMILYEEGEGYGFTEPRIMERACYIGILALKLGKTDIIDGLKEYIKSFEEAYRKKWYPEGPPEAGKSISPSYDQLLLEVHGLIERKRSRYGLMPILNRADENLLPLITEEDINKFIMSIWGVKIETHSRRMFL